MALVREQIEHLEHVLKEDGDWKNYSHSRKWLKKQLNRFMRRKNKIIEEDEVGRKTKRKPFKGWEY